MKATERRVKYFDCRIKAKVRGAKGSVSIVQPVDLATILEEFKRLVDSGVDIRTETVGEIQAWRMVDIAVNRKSNRAIVLINRVDSDAADQAIEHRDSGSFRVATKGSREANAYSAHIAFKLKPDGNDAYPALIEEAGVSSQRLSMLFSRAAKKSQEEGSSVFLYEHPSGAVNDDGDIKTLKGIYSFGFTGHPSADFVNELNNGKLRGIEIINGTSTGYGWDKYNSTHELSTSVFLKPVKQTVTNYKLAKSIVSQAKLKKMDEVRVKFEDADGDGRTLAFDVDTGCILNEDRYVKREYLRNFSARLDTGYQKIHSEIRDKMFYLLR